MSTQRKTNTEPVSKKNSFVFIKLQIYGKISFIYMTNQY